MPGGQTVAIDGALHRHSEIRPVLVRNESTGAFMADGFRSCYRPARCLLGHSAAWN